jgi:lipid-A-disaccharide synthase
MRLAKRLSKLGVKVLYYVAPQAWAWKPHRARALSETVHTLFTILPFEKNWFMERGVKQVRSIPHPLMLTYKKELHDIPAKPYGSWKSKLKILLLPGSRKFEIHNLLPIFLQTIKLLKKFYPVEVHLVKVSHVDNAIYEYYKSEIDVWYESTELTEAMRTCHLSLAASGTVTLSTGLFELPTVVCYQASLLNAFIYYNFIKYKGPISLTNIIHDEMVFPEFTQEQVNAQQLTRVIRTWLDNETAYNDLKTKLKNTKQLLSGEDFSVPQFISQVINERH